ncbi:DNA/RNA nuclease SfsA [Alteromonas halophila]|uniref:Sugar fermentation stimulation protein homolog n=1 Tax=Alteromonas halophila TaxID=516698 RepID=A0A918MXY0_9ALTE|nr:DNA/RNA nuclease SfsA [Alteromonas halophila]GGW83022.1 sugar fermentation stimulation protein [Alteromonas halophila]
MQFSSPLIPGTLIKRYKRFFADVRLDDGDVVTAHCPNTGAMTGCAEPGYRVYLSPADNPKRKLRYTWELAQTHEDHYIGVNTHNANKLVEEALKNRMIDADGLRNFDTYKREVTPPGSNSRFDFALYQEGDVRFAEVKSVTLARGNAGYFPDAVTARGAKHCEELAALAAQGVPTMLLFCVQHTAVQSVSVARDIDPNYARAVNGALHAGVTLVALGCEITKEKIEVNQSLPLKI